jgi:hypothetical protein
MSQGKKSADHNVEATWNNTVPGGFTAVKNVFLRNYSSLRLSHRQALMVIHVLSYKWNIDDPFPSVESIAKQLGCSKASVRRDIKAMQDLGFLVRRPKMRKDGSTESAFWDFSGLFAKLKEIEGAIPADSGESSESTAPSTLTRPAVRRHSSLTEQQIATLCEKLTPDEIVRADKNGVFRDTNAMTDEEALAIFKGIPTKGTPAYGKESPIDKMTDAEFLQYFRGEVS